MQRPAGGKDGSPYHQQQRHDHIQMTSHQRQQLAMQQKNMHAQPPRSPASRPGTSHCQHAPVQLVLSPPIDPMDGSDDEESMLSPEEETLVEAREFGKLDRLDPEAKRTRLRELNSPFPTREEIQISLDGLQSCAGKGLLEMAKFVHDQIQGLIAEEQMAKKQTLRFKLEPEFVDSNTLDREAEQEIQDDSVLDQPSNKAQDSHLCPADSTKGNESPQTTIGLLLVEKPETLGYPGRCIVHGAVPGSPAYFCGKIRPNDIVMQVDDVNVSVDNVAGRIRAQDQPGKRIKLLVDRAGRKRPFHVHLSSAHTSTVAKKRAMFEMLAELAEATRPSCEDADIDSDDERSGIAMGLHRDVIEAIKEVEREHMQDEIILIDENERKDRMLQRIQILIREFLDKGRDLLQTETDRSGDAAIPVPLPEGPNTVDVSIKSPRPEQGADIAADEVKTIYALQTAQREALIPGDDKQTTSQLKQAVDKKGSGWLGSLLRASTSVEQDVKVQEKDASSSIFEERALALEIQNRFLQQQLSTADKQVATLQDELQVALATAREFTVLLKAEQQVLSAKINLSNSLLLSPSAKAALQDQERFEELVKERDILTGKLLESNSSVEWQALELEALRKKCETLTNQRDTQPALLSEALVALNDATNGLARTDQPSELAFASECKEPASSATTNEEEQSPSGVAGICGSLQTQQSPAGKDRLIEKLLRDVDEVQKEKEILAEKVAQLWSEDVKKDEEVKMLTEQLNAVKTELSDMKRAGIATDSKAHFADYFRPQSPKPPPWTHPAAASRPTIVAKPKINHAQPPSPQLHPRPALHGSTPHQASRIHHNHST